MSKTKQNVIVRLELVIADDQIDLIEILEDDDIEKVVDDFCRVRNYSEEINEYIMDQIILNIDQLEKSLESNEILDNRTNGSTSELDKVNIQQNENKDNRAKADETAQKQKAVKPSKQPRKKKQIGGVLYTTHDNNGLKGGERLYENNLKRAKKRENSLKKIREQRLQNEMKEATFTPKLNDLSIEISTNLNRSDIPVEDRLIRIGEEIRVNRLKKHTKRKLDEELNHSYTPRISNTSKIISAIKRNIRKEMIRNLLGSQDQYENHTDSEEELNSSLYKEKHLNYKRLDNAFNPSAENNRYHEAHTGRNINKEATQKSVSKSEDTFTTNNMITKKNTSSTITNAYTQTKQIPTRVNLKQPRNETDSVIKIRDLSSDETNINKYMNYTSSSQNKQIKSKANVFQITHIKKNSNDDHSSQFFEMSEIDNNNLKHIYQAYGSNMKEESNLDGFGTTKVLPNNRKQISEACRQDNSKVYSKKKPKVSNNAGNSNTVNKQTNVKSIHEVLYAESKLNQIKQTKRLNEHMEKVYPFKHVNRSKSPVYKEISERRKFENKQDFVNRLYNSKKVEEELIVQRERASKLIEDTKLFKPKISRGPLDQNRREITVNLDGFYDQRLIDKKVKLEEEQKEIKKQNRSYWIEKSMKSILKIKLMRYKEIFDKLDSDKDGMISAKHIKLSDLEASSLEKLTPLLENLQISKKTMDFKEFCLSIDKLIDSIEDIKCKDSG